MEGDDFHSLGTDAILHVFPGRGGRARTCRVRWARFGILTSGRLPRSGSRRHGIVQVEDIGHVGDAYPQILRDIYCADLRQSRANYQSWVGSGVAIAGVAAAVAVVGGGVLWLTAFFAGRTRRMTRRAGRGDSRPDCGAHW